MKRRITCLSVLLLALCGAYAQDISRYEYWTDDDYANRSIVEAEGSEITLTVSTDGLGPGIHFLNFRASRSDGVWGNFYRYLYYIPAQQNSGGGSVSVEYWIDDNQAGNSREAADEGQLLLAIDISELSPGVHYFNCTAMNEAGERGNSERYLFYVPNPSDDTTPSAFNGFEYWLDDDYAGKTVVETNEAESVFAINIQGLTSGVHYFNCRAMNEQGTYGAPIRQMFYIPQSEVSTDCQLASAEYWLDDDYAGKVSLLTNETDQAFSIDVSHLASGVHYFNYQATDSEGRKGNLVRQLFYLARGNNAPGSELLEYEYWIDDDVANKVTGKGSQAEYVFNIDVSQLAVGTHTFNFRAKNQLEVSSELFVESFEISEPATLLGDVNNDGVVDIVDVANLVSHLAGFTPKDFNTKAADVNNDETIDSADVNELVKLILNK